MSTKQDTMDYILDQLSSLGDIRARKMFGEYAIYLKDKVVGLVCDDTLFIKITTEGKEFVGDKYFEGFPYKGAKVKMQIDGDDIENREWLCKLIRITTDNLPTPKTKKIVWLENNV